MHMNSNGKSELLNQSQHVLTPSEGESACNRREMRTIHWFSRNPCTLCSSYVRKVAWDYQTNTKEQKKCEILMYFCMNLLKSTVGFCVSTEIRLSVLDNSEWKSNETISCQNALPSACPHSPTVWSNTTPSTRVHGPQREELAAFFITGQTLWDQQVLSTTVGCLWSPVRSWELLRPTDAPE